MKYIYKPKYAQLLEVNSEDVESKLKELGGVCKVFETKPSEEELFKAFEEYYNGRKYNGEPTTIKKVALNIEKIKPYCSEEDYNIILRYLNGDSFNKELK